MRFSPTALAGATVIDLEPHTDERGFFARSFCREDFLAHGLEPAVEQCNVSLNHRAGTLRGMHWQGHPAEEAKLVRCTRGALLDVIVDLRPGSPTRLRSVGVELTAANRRALYIPPLFAHGFQTLEDDTEVTYQVSARHSPEDARGLRHDDPALALAWPRPVTVISARDRTWPLLEPAAAS